ncbi:MAG: methyltransferase family protein [Acidimicrobiales bacterium]
MQPDRTMVGPRTGTRWFLAGYAGVVGFPLLEATVRQPESASDLHASKEDAGSTRGIVAAYLLAALSAPLLRRLRVRPLPAVCAPLGLAILAAGLARRVWSMQTLAEAYSRTLRVTNEQSVTDDGPYRHIRHPGYLGSLLIWSGFALSSGSAVVGSVLALLLPAYAHRMDAEERLLDRDLPGYADYRSHTKKLVPGLW